LNAGGQATISGRHHHAIGIGPWTAIAASVTTLKQANADAGCGAILVSRRRLTNDRCGGDKLSRRQPMLLRTRLV
jgi:hypothetical protein